MSDTYLAWNGREYPWPPPERWELRSDGRYWPVESAAEAGAPTGFAPQYGPSASSIYARPDSLPAPSPHDRVGQRPLRRRAYVSAAVGTLLAAMLVSFVRIDVLGFVVSQDDFAVDVNGDDQGPAFQEAPFGEERELSRASIDRLVSIVECTNDTGAAAAGTVFNDLPDERSFLVNVEFTVDGERQLDGFAELTVPPGEGRDFTARSASPALNGDVGCSIGSVFRFISN